MDNPENLTLEVREYRRDNQEWTIHLTMILYSLVLEIKYMLKVINFWMKPFYYKLSCSRRCICVFCFYWDWCLPDRNHTSHWIYILQWHLCISSLKLCVLEHNNCEHVHETNFYETSFLCLWKIDGFCYDITNVRWIWSLASITSLSLLCHYQRSYYLFRVMLSIYLYILKSTRDYGVGRKVQLIA
jgi:hypothetical protein